MDRVVCHVRRVGLVAVALLSVAVGVGTIWVVASPEAIAGMSTWILFGVVGLMVLPLAAAAALVADRRALAHAKRLCAPTAEVMESATHEPAAGMRGVAHDGANGRAGGAMRHRHLRVTAAAQET